MKLVERLPQSTSDTINEDAARIKAIRAKALQLRQQAIDLEQQASAEEEKDLQQDKVAIAENEEKRQYSSQESAAVGKEVAKSLVKVLRAQGNELKNIKLTGIGVNKFNIHTEYGNDKGADTFRFTLNPDTTSIYLDLGNETLELSDFMITQGNEVSLPTPELEDKLADAMVKYVGEPSDEEYDEKAAMEPEQDIARINKYISEGNSEADIELIRKFIEMAETKPTEFEELYKKAEVQASTTAGTKFNHLLSLMDKANAYYYQSMANQDRFDADREGMGEEALPEVTKHVGGEYVNYPKEGGKRLGTFPSKKAAQKQLAAIEISKQKKNEVLDPVGKEDDDINNDEKVDSTDKYLANRRQAIAKNMKEDLDVGHQDNEPGMLKSDVYRIAKMASMLYKQLDKYEKAGEVDFPHWWQAKIIKAYDYLQSAYGYLDGVENTHQIDTVVIPAVALNEKKGTCCHKCGHVHVKGTSHPTPYLTGQKNCKYRD